MLQFAESQKHLLSQITRACDVVTRTPSSVRETRTTSTATTPHSQNTSCSTSPTPSYRLQGPLPNPILHPDDTPPRTPNDSSKDVTPTGRIKVMSASASSNGGSLTSPSAPLFDIKPSSDSKFARTPSHGAVRILLIGIHYFSDMLSDRLQGSASDILRITTWLSSVLNTCDVTTKPSLVEWTILSDCNLPPLGNIPGNVVRFTRPTKRAMLEGLLWVYERSAHGDAGFVYFRGNGRNFFDSYQSCILPCDHKLHGVVTVEDIHQRLVSPAAVRGVRLTFLMDAQDADNVVHMPFGWSPTQTEPLRFLPIPAAIDESSSSIPLMYGDVVVIALCRVKRDAIRLDVGTKQEGTLTDVWITAWEKLAVTKGAPTFGKIIREMDCIMKQRQGNDNKNNNNTPWDAIVVPSLSSSKPFNVEEKFNVLEML
eukprot:PhF_6_TR2214/c0_g1_i3/m.3694